MKSILAAILLASAFTGTLQVQATVVGTASVGCTDSGCYLSVSDHSEVVATAAVIFADGSRAEVDISRGWVPTEILIAEARFKTTAIAEVP